MNTKQSTIQQRYAAMPDMEKLAFRETVNRLYQVGQAIQTAQQNGQYDRLPALVKTAVSYAQKLGDEKLFLYLLQMQYELNKLNQKQRPAELDQLSKGMDFLPIEKQTSLAQTTQQMLKTVGVDDGRFWLFDATK